LKELLKKRKQTKNKRDALQSKNEDKMDKGIDLWIYIFFIIVSVIGGIIKNISKKKEEEAQRQRRKTVANQDVPSTSMPPISGPQKTTNPFEEFLRRQLEQFEEPEEEPLDNIPTYKPQPIDTIPSVKTQPIDTIPTGKSPSIEYTPMNLEAVNEGEAAFESTTKEIYSDTIFENGFSFSNEIADQKAFEYDTIAKGDLTELHEEMVEFDASQAVVYSEILRRPIY
jgi:hypothetical protein